MSDFVCVPIDKDIYNEFIIRTGRSEDVATWIENIVQGFLDQTIDDHPQWSEEHYERLADEEDARFIETYGLPNKGYQWKNVFLPNGTRLRISYMGKDHFAEVRHEQIVYEGDRYTPSQFASKVANNTNRNAWRDIWIKLPNENRWQFANDLRRSDS